MKSNPAVDAQLLALHKVIAAKLRQQPELTELAKEKLEQRFAAKLIYRNIYLDWWAVIDMRDDIDQMLQQLCTEDEQMQKLRRFSPFTGILSEKERETFFADYQRIN